MTISITAISDLHGYFPDLLGGDLLIICGDLTANNRVQQYPEFESWLKDQPYKMKVVVAGNHDGCLARGEFKISGAEFLVNRSIEWEGLNIWGSPYTARFLYQNPTAMAFSERDPLKLKEYWDCIPEGTDIVITHTPPFGILDKSVFSPQRTGCPHLLEKVRQIKPRAHFFGHIHEGYGLSVKDGILFCNCAHVTERYEPRDTIYNFEFDLKNNNITINTGEEIW